jgi:hypothetical protein
MEMLYTNRLGWARRGGGSYKNVLKAGAGQEGLVLQLSLLFRLVHLPYLFPGRR